MSHNCHSEVCKNVAYIGTNKTIDDAMRAREDAFDDDAHSPEPPLLLGEWNETVWVKGGEADYDDDLIGHRMVKTTPRGRKMVVRLINSSPYSHVETTGEWVVCGDKKKDVEEFLKALGLTKSIKKLDAVQSWW